MSAVDRAIRERLDDDVRRFAAAIRANAPNPPSDPEQPIGDSWRAFTRTCLDEAEIALTDRQFEIAWRRMWQSAFMGGSFTQDARRVLQAAYALHVEVPGGAA